jgi:uncharacterized protein (TIGR00266 family)
MSEAVWYVAAGKNRFGPFTTEQIVTRIQSRLANGETLVYGPSTGAWIPIRQVPDFASFLGGAAVAAPPPIPVGAGGRSSADEIDYEISGDDMQFIQIELDPGESAVAEAGAMMFMTDGIQMQAVFGDGRGQSQGFMDKLVGAGKRLLTGESLFMTVFTNSGPGKQRVAFAAPYAGRIIPMDLGRMGGEMICQKDSFLCAARGVTISIAFQKRIGVGLFGGEGFIMQRLAGDGLVFVHAGGAIFEKELAPGERLRVDTGCIVALAPSVDYDIQMVEGIKTAIFGGEGLFYAVLRGPGKVWLQSLPLSRLADRIVGASWKGGGRKEEGSVLDVVGGLGRLLDGGGR